LIGDSRNPGNAAADAVHSADLRHFDSAAGGNHRLVMPGLVPGIHEVRIKSKRWETEARKTWMAGTSPTMTE